MRVVGLAVALAVSLVVAPLAAEGEQRGRVATVGELVNDPLLHKTLAVVERSAIEAAAHATGVTIETFEARDSATLPAVFAAIKKARAEALVVVYTARTAGQRGQIADLAAANRLPLVSEQRELADAGGLITYGPRLLDKILKGTKPGDLPIEQPTKFELVVNLKTAKALGLTIPPSLLQRADQVIE